MESAHPVQRRAAKVLYAALQCMVAVTLLAVFAAGAHAQEPTLESLAQAAQGGRWQELQKQAQAMAEDEELPATERGQAYAYLSLAHINLSQPGPALDAADEAVRMHPGHARGWLMRGTAYMMLRQLASAEEDFRKAVRVDSGIWEAYRNLAELSQARGDMPGALDWFAKAVEHAPNNTDLATEYALLLHGMGLHGRADAALTDVIGLVPQAPGPYNNRGMVRLAQGRFDDALTDFTRAILLDPAFEEARVNRGNVLRVFKRYKESLADFTQGLESRPESVKLLVGRMYTRAEMGDYTGAAQDIAAAYRHANVDPYVLNEYAWFLATCPDEGVRDGVRAMQLAREAIGLSAGPIPGYYDTLAAALAEAGEFENAVAAQKQAISFGAQAGLPQRQLQEWTERLEGYEHGLPYRNNVP